MLKWRRPAQPIPKPHNTLLLKDTSRVKNYNFITQKCTQPSQACSEGYLYLLLYVTGFFLYLGSIKETY